MINRISFLLVAASMTMGIGPVEQDPATSLSLSEMLQALGVTEQGREPNILLAQSYSCSPRKTCSKTIRSCEEARWLFNNCSWGYRLDGDNDGIPCENLC